MKDAYERRIEALEKRLAESEAKASRTDSTPTHAETPSAARAVEPTASAFNPALSLILQGTYANTSQDPNNYQITGFIPSGGEVGPPKRRSLSGRSGWSQICSGSRPVPTENASSART